MNVSSPRHLFSCLALLVLLLPSCSGDKAVEPPPTPVRVLAVTAGSAESSLKYTASFVPKAQVEMAFKVGGYVEDLLQVNGPDGKPRDVQPGDQVAAGALLARVRVSDYAAQSNQARGALNEAQAQLRQAELDYQRASELLKGGYIAKSEFDRATEMLSVARAKVEQGRSALQAADINVGDTELKSPMACFVVKRQVERGTLVKPGTLAFVLSDLSSVKAQFGVPDTALPLVKAGDPLSVVVEVQNAAFELKEGMIASVTLVGDQPGQALGMVVPLSAVVRPADGSQGYMVWVVADSGGKPRVAGRKVQLGAVKGDTVAVTSGLAVGEKVVVSGTSQVVEGQAVNIIP